MADEEPVDSPDEGTVDDGSGDGREESDDPAGDGSARGSPDDAWTPPADWPDDEEVVRTAADAAEDVVFSRLDRSTVADLDVTVSFDAGILEVDVYLDAPDAGADVERVADDAALAARAAADDLLES